MMHVTTPIIITNVRNESDFVIFSLCNTGANSKLTTKVRAPSGANVLCGAYPKLIPSTTPHMVLKQMPIEFNDFAFNDLASLPCILFGFFLSGKLLAIRCKLSPNAFMHEAREDRRTPNQTGMVSLLSKIN